VSTIIRAAAVASLLLSTGATTALAQGQGGPATRFTKWVCVIDLQQALGGDYTPSLPTKLMTTNTEKLCPGSNPDNVSITCLAKIDNWTLGNKVYQSLQCQIFKGQCGARGFVPAGTQKLAIAADGSAQLTCSGS
jgi:hypothetical protein